MRFIQTFKSVPTLQREAEARFHGQDLQDEPQPPTRGPGTPGRFPRGGIRDLAGRGGPTRTVSQELVRGQPFSAEPLCDEGGAGRGAGRHPGHGRNLDAGDCRGVPGVGRGAEENRGRRRKGGIPSRARGPESERLRDPHHGVTMATIDATGHVVGRLASILAKRLLNGEDIVVVNAEKAIVTGRKQVVFEEYRARHARGSTASRMRGIGPNYPRRPDMILRRTISRMMPYQQPRGREALKRLRVYLSLPDAYKDKPLEIVEGGGIMGQADAVRTAIARGLVQYLNDNELETLFREYDRTLIVPDTRRKLPKKPLGRGARKKRQKSYR